MGINAPWKRPRRDEVGNEDDVVAMLMQGSDDSYNQVLTPTQPDHPPPDRLLGVNAPWKRPRRDSRAAQPASDPFSRAAQPAYSQSSLDALMDIQHCILSANARDYATWKRNNPHEKRKTWSNLLGHVQVAIRHRFASNAEQPAQRGIPLEVLLGWMVSKFDNLKSADYHARMNEAKELLHALAQDEHRLHRMQILVEKANAINEQGMPVEKQIDISVLNECLPLLAKEVETKLNALKDIA